MKRKGYKGGTYPTGGLFMEGDRVREEWFRDGMHCKEGV